MTGSRVSTARRLLLVALALAAGATDALSFVALGGVFTSVVTGNLVLAGVALAAGDVGELAHMAVAIGGYAAGVLAAARWLARRPAGQDQSWPAGLTPILVVQAVLLAGVLAGWLAQGGHPVGGGQLAPAGVCGIAMGGQSVLVRALPGGWASTTYLTGMLTDGLTRLVTPGERNRAAAFGLVLAVLLGAAAEVLLLRGLRPAAAALPLLLVVIALVTAISGLRGRPSGRAAG